MNFVVGDDDNDVLPQLSRSEFVSKSRTLISTHYKHFFFLQIAASQRFSVYVPLCTYCTVHANENLNGKYKHKCNLSVRCRKKRRVKQQLKIRCNLKTLREWTTNSKSNQIKHIDRAIEPTERPQKQKCENNLKKKFTKNSRNWYWFLFLVTLFLTFRWLLLLFATADGFFSFYFSSPFILSTFDELCVRQVEWGAAYVILVLLLLSL